MALIKGTIQSPATPQKLIQKLLLTSKEIFCNQDIKHFNLWVGLPVIISLKFTDLWIICSDLCCDLVCSLWSSNTEAAEKNSRLEYCAIEMTR